MERREAGRAVRTARPRTRRPVRGRSWAWAGVVLVAGLLAVAGGCGEKAEERGDETGPPVTESTLLEPRAPRTLSWPESPEAHAYEVHAWAGDRLLFVERTLRPELTTTYALERAMAPFDSVVLRVRVEARDGSRAGEIIEVPVD